MPNPRAFLEAFGLRRGMPLGPHMVVIKVGIGHDVVERFRVYAFPLSLRVVAARDTTKDQVLQAAETLLSGTKTVLSQYGNPYRCFIDQFHVKPVASVDAQSRVFEVSALGHGNRILP